MKRLVIILLTLFPIVAWAQPKQPQQDKPKAATTITLNSWQLAQTKAFDDKDQEIQRALEIAAQINAASRDAFFKTIIGRDLTERDSVVYEAPNILIFDRKVIPKKP